MRIWINLFEAADTPDVFELRQHDAGVSLGTLRYCEEVGVLPYSDTETRDAKKVRFEVGGFEIGCIIRNEDGLWTSLDGQEYGTQKEAAIAAITSKAN